MLIRQWSAKISSELHTTLEAKAKYLPLMLPAHIFTTESVRE
jgi:hypothetical protein